MSTGKNSKIFFDFSVWYIFPQFVGQESEASCEGGMQNSL